MKLYEKHDSLRDRFEVLAFHDATAKTFEELDQRLKLVIEKRWGGKSLPFPILLDSTGATVKTFGIRAYPTNVLIDPEGRILHEQSEIRSRKERFVEFTPTVAGEYRRRGER